MQMNVVVLKELRRLDVSGYGGDRAAVRTLKEVQKLEARTRRGTSFK